jgi:hypothetical protein
VTPWAELRGAERGRRAFVICDGPSAVRILPARGLRICLNCTPALHVPDYWVYAEPLARFRRRDLLGKCLAAAGVCPRVYAAEVGEPKDDPGAISAQFCPPEHEAAEPFDGLDRAWLPRNMGSLGAGLGLAAWLECAEIELVGCDFGPVGGRYHWYDPPEPQLPRASTGGVYEMFWRTFEGRAVPALAARCIEIRYSRPGYAGGAP